MSDQPSAASDETKQAEIRHGTYRAAITAATIVSCVGIIAWAYVRIDDQSSNDPSWLKLAKVAIPLLGPTGLITIASYIYEKFLPVAYRSANAWAEKAIRGALQKQAETEQKKLDGVQ